MSDRNKLDGIDFIPVGQMREGLIVGHPKTIARLCVKPTPKTKTDRKPHYYPKLIDEADSCGTCEYYCTGGSVPLSSEKPDGERNTISFGISLEGFCSKLKIKRWPNRPPKTDSCYELHENCPIMSREEYNEVSKIGV